MLLRKLGLGASLLSALSGVMLVTTTASATPKNYDNVTFCHATASTTNPYVVITTDPASIIKKGHGDHTGPVFDPSGGKKQPAWGDIIPAFDYPAFGNTPAGHFSGLNLPAGAGILAAGCSVPVVPSPSPTPSETPTPTPTPSNIPTPTHTELVPPGSISTPVVETTPAQPVEIGTPVVKKRHVAKHPVVTYTPPRLLAHTGPVNVAVLGYGLMLLGLGAALLFGSSAIPGRKTD